MTFGENLKNARIKNKLTQQQLADMLGISKSTITNYEGGKREPDVFMIKKLAKLLEVTGDYLIGYDPGANEKPLSDDALRIARAYDMMTDKGRAAVNAVVELAISTNS